MQQNNRAATEMLEVEVEHGAMIDIFYVSLSFFQIYNLIIESPMILPSKHLVDMQKKIMPWNILPASDDTVLQSEFANKKESRTSQLILCAVLVDKIPNLGGLCRTAEIFGVRKLLLGSHRYLSDPVFKSLSVSAEKWVDIEQVMPIKLVSYLTEIKSEGYHLIGVEQTANSKMIGQYKFPEKTVLVLGNEKKGNYTSMIIVC